VNNGASSPMLQTSALREEHMSGLRRCFQIVCATMTLGVAWPAIGAPPRPVPTANRILVIQDTYPDVSKSGRLVFQSNRLGGAKLFVSNLDGTDLRQLTSGPGDDEFPVWSFDGNHIAFVSTRSGSENVWVIRADGSEPRNLTKNTASNIHPAWSPDGKRIIFCSTLGGNGIYDLYVMNADGTGLVRRTDNELAWDTFPSFSPDGRKILFRRLMRARTPEGWANNSEIMVMNSDGSHLTNITNNPWFDGWPWWSPDGRYIAFSSNREDYYQIFVMKSDGSDVQQIVHSSSNDMRPKWLPGGRGLVFNRESEGRIETLRADF
jgi:TolB protein